MRYNDEGIVEFNRLREQRLQTLPLDLLATTPTIKSSKPGQKSSGEPPVTEKEPVKGKEQEVEQEKERKQSSEVIDLETQIDPNLLQEWQEFDSITNNPETPPGFGIPQVTVSQETTTTTVPGEGTSNLPSTKDTQIIPKDPSDQIVLQIEAIPPLDVFYSPKHKVVVTR